MKISRLLFPFTQADTLLHKPINHSQAEADASVTANESELGWLPALSLVVAVSLMIVAISFWGEINQAAWAEPVFWLGVLGAYLSVGLRLVNRKIKRVERVGLIILLGLSLYLVKVMHSPFAFTFSDELLHYFNAESILITGKLFTPNPILTSSVSYPGLEILTSMLSGVSGLSIFHAGLVVDGLARMILVLTLFLFFEQVSRSSYIAGLAVLFYMVNPNYLYWSAQFAYETLALPIALLVIYTLVVRQKETDQRRWHARTLIIYLLIVVVIVTHHITSLMLITFLFATVLVSIFLRRFVKDERIDAIGPALFALVLAVIWLVIAGHDTQVYLYNIFQNSLHGIQKTLSGAQAGRVPFSSSSGIVAPLWERVVGLGSVGLTFFGLPFGLYALWKHRPLKTVVWVLIGASLLYFGMLGLRLVPAAWEIANRASEFLYVGLAFVLAFGFRNWFKKYSSSWNLTAFFLFFIAVLFAGSVISGWPPKIRLAKPYLAQSNTTIIQPEAKEAALWMLDNFGPNHVIASSKADALYLLSFGRQQAISGNSYDISQMMNYYHSRIYRQNVVDIYHLEYIQIDRRLLSWDNMAGGYLDPQNNQGHLSSGLVDKSVRNMFDGEQGAQRIFDSGNTVIYDVKDYNHVTQAK